MQTHLIKHFLKQTKINLENAKNIIRKIKLDQIHEFEHFTFETFKKQSLNSLNRSYGYLENLINKLDTE